MIFNFLPRQLFELSEWHTLRQRDSSLQRRNLPIVYRKNKIQQESFLLTIPRRDLKSLEAAIQKLGKPIEYHGLHYVGALKYLSQTIFGGRI